MISARAAANSSSVKMAAIEAKRPAEELWAVRESEDPERRRYEHRERMRQLHDSIAADHERKAAALLEEGKG